MPGTHKDVSRDKTLQAQFKEITGIECKGILMQYTSKKGGRIVLYCKQPFTKKIRRKRKSSGGHTVVQELNRYRERDLLSPLFINKKRSPQIKPGQKLGELKEFFSNGNLFQTTQVNATGASEMSTHVERIWDRRNPGPPYRTGGPLTYVRYFVPAADARRVAISSRTPQSGSYKTYEGVFVDNGAWVADSSSAYATYRPPDITGYDTKAWDSLKPRVTKAGLAQFLYELRELPRQLETTANAMANAWRSFGGGYSKVFMHPKSVADNFLNHQFGWVPFISDIIQMYDAFRNSEKYLAELTAQNNTWVRKRRVLESTTEQMHVGRLYGSGTEPGAGDFRFQDFYTQMTVDGIPTNAFCDIRQELTTHVWAVGSFKFYRPEFDVGTDGIDSLTLIRRYLTLYGLRINPTTIWRITPWSWAVDWFSGFGKFIERLDDFVVDGIVSRYLYIMKSTSKTVTKTSVLNFKNGQRVLQWQRQLATKQRKVADSPYGFDQTWNNLSIRQWAILGAIGITRSGSGFTNHG